MTALMIILRIIHIFSGIFWVGTNLLFLFFLEPALRAAGPAGGAVMGRLTVSKFTPSIGVAAILTVLAGFIMYVIDSHVFQFSWIASPAGAVLSIGAFFGILAAGVSLFMQRPASLGIAALQKEIQAAGGSPTPDQLEKLRGLQKRLAFASRIGVVLMSIAVLGMESARELGNI